MKWEISDPPLFGQWLEEKRRIAKSTSYCYVHSLRRFLASNPDIENLEDYNNFIVTTCIKKRCIHYFSVMRAYIEFKITDSNLRTRLIEGLVKPKERHDWLRERKHLDEDTIFEVINNLEFKKHRIIALIQSLTGVRAGDLYRLRRGQIVSETYQGNPVLRLNIVGKRQKRNVVFIHDEIAQQIILDYINNVINFDDYYFIEITSFIKKRMDTSNEFKLINLNYLRYWIDLKKALQTVGVAREDFATHDFRRCFARRCWEKYKDVYVLQSVLNHNDPKVTLRYLHQSGLKNIDYHYEMQK